MHILGVSGLYHDSAAALVGDAGIIAAAQEERFTRKKHDPRFPVNAIQYCINFLQEGSDLDWISYYENPVLTLDRVFQTGYTNSPAGYELWEEATVSFLQTKSHIFEQLKQYAGAGTKLVAIPHHLSHAASAFYPSTFDRAAILIVDGVGEWATTTLAVGDGNTIRPIKEIRFPHSLGLLYSAFTHYCGFKVNSGEYKLMGLAPFGNARFVGLIKDHLIDLHPDGSFELNMNYFGFHQYHQMITPEFEVLFKNKTRRQDDPLLQVHADLAASIQAVINEAMQLLAKSILDISETKNLCLAGGVALNCVANGHLLRTLPQLGQLFVQPAAGDAGGALGCALEVAHGKLGMPRRHLGVRRDGLSGSLLGPDFSIAQILAAINSYDLKAIYIESKDDLNKAIAKALACGDVVARFAGRMEFGPRALGNRSILADARRPDGQKHINMCIKYRESWRPFAPIVLEEFAKDYFDIRLESPYMLIVGDVVKERRKPFVANVENSSEDAFFETIGKLRSDIPAVTHVDYSARIQTVDQERNLELYNLMMEFQKITGSPVLLNTSFNVRGEPLVCSPKDAIQCFLNAQIDVLALENFLIYREEQESAIKKYEGAFQYEPD